MFVFGLCRELRIDDPIAWMNAAPPQVVDQWIAYEIVKQEKAKKSQDMTPEDALSQLKQISG